MVRRTGAIMRYRTRPMVSAHSRLPRTTLILKPVRAPWRSNLDAGGTVTAIALPIALVAVAIILLVWQRSDMREIFRTNSDIRTQTAQLCAPDLFVSPAYAGPRTVWVRALRARRRTCETPRR